ncbi:hypothetical protein JAAARDRAFT_333077 [Jaapia argillacea MUCL 33604]|uniref:Uncharacterized protein n=1 Tax=Jaapia argillacea MUCL 33604 TaxID=933084 RepID=A0A067PVJ3_9AGAM|nr:hypothetical protein JAAARDRAFT_333077 [Jaapia argillacea MUCL 33604]
MVTFFVINYIAHAASIPTVAGATWYDTVFWTTISLFLPFAGLGKAMGLVLNYILVGKSDLEKAWACDALFVVARSSHWEPGDKPEEVYVKFPVDFRTLQDECTATIKVTRDGEGRDIKPHESLKIHGGIYLPPGYQIDYPDPYYLSEYFPFRSTINRRISLSKTQSWVKMTISVAQLVYSTTTIYRSRGSQLEKYGYAAFGLSVFPYAFMSLANFLCVGIVGEDIFLVLSDVVKANLMVLWAVKGNRTWNGQISHVPQFPLRVVGVRKKRRAMSVFWRRSWWLRLKE